MLDFFLIIRQKPPSVGNILKESRGSSESKSEDKKGSEKEHDEEKKEKDKGPSKNDVTH